MRPLAITLGDPAGIGPEVVLKAIRDLDPSQKIWLFGSWTLAESQDRHGLLRAFSRTRGQPTDPSPDRLFIDVGDETGAALEPGVVRESYGRVALASIDAASRAMQSGACSALVTAPIHKGAVAAAGSPYPGHTELLAAASGLHTYGREFAMYFDSPRLRTVLLSVHVPLSEAIAAIDSQKIAELAALTDRELRKLYGKRPSIAVAGVNPHAGEGGRFGREEEIIATGVAAARAAGLDVTGPYAPDTVFLRASRGDFDVVVSMYHDQGLIAVKTLDFEHSVNVTLGLPYLRVSVDHGTAFDIAGKNLADPLPMRYAIEWALDHGART